MLLSMEAKRINRTITDCRRHLLLGGEATAVSCAVVQLKQLDGVLSLNQDDQGRDFIIDYDTRHVTFADIEHVIQQCGATLRHSRWHDLRYTLWAYRDKIVHDTYLGRLVRRNVQASTRQAFASTYSRKPHGCRDPRPTVWRKYF